MTNRKWKKIDGRKGDLRFFVEDNPYQAPELRSLFVADNSGSNPDCTDDGPLVVATAKPVTIGISKLSGRPTVRIPVRKEADWYEDGYFTEAGLWAVDVLRNAGCTFDLSMEVAGLRKALADIDGALVRPEKETA